MKIICSGKIANTTVGHIDHALAYACGLQRLGHEVYLMEQVGGGRCTDSRGCSVDFHAWNGRSHFEAVAKRYGLWPRCCLIYKQGEQTYGMSFADAVRVARSCDLLICRSGRIDKVAEIFENVQCRAYIDGNPGSTQVGVEQGDPDFAVLEGYDHLFTMGLNIGQPVCPIPCVRRRWHTILRPVVMSMWPVCHRSGDQPFTTISTWKGRSRFHWQGQASGEKSDNWYDYIDLPGETGQALEIALRIDSADEQADRELFESRGWRITDPARLRSFDDYRNYVGDSRGEFSVAHNRYVKFATGWFSDRSAVYLASGKPVLVQSTGIERVLPTGRGLLTFSTMAEAVAGIEEINRDYPAHCRAARQIAEEYFDAKRVLSTMLDQIAGSDQR